MTQSDARCVTTEHMALGAGNVSPHQKAHPGTDLRSSKMYGRASRVDCVHACALFQCLLKRREIRLLCSPDQHHVDILYRLQGRLARSTSAGTGQNIAGLLYQRLAYTRTQHHVGVLYHPFFVGILHIDKCLIHFCISTCEQSLNRRGRS